MYEFSFRNKGYNIFFRFDANTLMVAIGDRYCVERSVPSGVENAILIERGRVFSRHMGLVQNAFDAHVERDQFAKQAACGEIVH